MVKEYMPIHLQKKTDILIKRRHLYTNLGVNKEHNTTQHNTTQHNTAQHSTTQHNTTQHSTTQHNTTQHNTAQHNTTQHNTTQHNTTHLLFTNLAAPKQGKKCCYILEFVWCTRVCTCSEPRQYLFLLLRGV